MASRRSAARNISRNSPKAMLSLEMEKAVEKFRSLAEADGADRDFYRKLSGRERLDILLQLSKHEPERRLERVYRIIKLPGR